MKTAIESAFLSFSHLSSCLSLSLNWLRSFVHGARYFLRSFLFQSPVLSFSLALYLSRSRCCLFIRGIFTLYYVLPRVKALTMVHYTRLVYRNRSLVRWAYIRRRRSSRLTRNVGPATYNASDLFNNDDR